MELAVDAARGSAEPAAWAMTQLGKIHFSTGAHEEAAHWYERALTALPGYVFALDALAHVEAAEGNLARAIELELQATETNPLPQFVATLGDLYEASGQDAHAREQRELMDAIETLLAENGVRTDLETAVYYADHGIRAGEALALAEQAHRERPCDPRRTTRSPGRSTATSAARRRSLRRSGRCGSEPSTRRSTSTAA